MNKNGVYLQLYARALAPSRDYYGLTITEKEIVLNVWNISYGPHIFPKRQKCLLQEFTENKSFMMEINTTFGAHVLDYCKALSRNDLKLQCMPTKIFLYILRYLATNDILKLGQTSKIFFELCNRDDVWKVLFGKLNQRKPNRSEIREAEAKGWKSLLKYKLLFQDSRKLSKNSSSKPNSAVKSLKSSIKSVEVVKSNSSKPSKDSDKPSSKSKPKAVSIKVNAEPVRKPKSNFTLTTSNVKTDFNLLSKLNEQIKSDIKQNINVKTNFACVNSDETRHCTSAKTMKEVYLRTIKDILDNETASCSKMNSAPKASNTCNTVSKHPTKPHVAAKSNCVSASNLLSKNNAKIKNSSKVQEVTQNNKLNLLGSKSTSFNLINNLTTECIKEKNINFLQEKKTSDLKSSLKSPMRNLKNSNQVKIKK